MLFRLDSGACITVIYRTMEGGLDSAPPAEARIGVAEMRDASALSRWRLSVIIQIQTHPSTETKMEIEMSKDNVKQALKMVLAGYGLDGDADMGKVGMAAAADLYTKSVVATLVDNWLEVSGNKKSPEQRAAIVEKTVRVLKDCCAG